MKTKFQKGFTLVELLVVVALVAILAAIAIMVINPTQLQNRAKDSTLKATLDKIGLAASGIAATSDTQAFPTCAVLAASLNGVNTAASQSCNSVTTPTTNTFKITIGSAGQSTFTYFNTAARGCVSVPALAGGSDWRWCSSSGLITQAGVCTAGC